MSKIIYDKEGNFKDVSDEGEQMCEIEANIDRELMLKKLPERVRQIGELILHGYNYAEIAGRLGLTETNVKQICHRNRLCNF